MKRYLNLKTNYGTETVDQLDSKDFDSFKHFKAEIKRLLNEYHISGMQVYSSQRKAK
jgi:hypothetical protein